jgi:replicative DNA helicase Mcm
MSQVLPESQVEPEIVEKCLAVLEDYYDQEIKQLVGIYPDERSLYVDFQDVRKKSDDLAWDYQEQPDLMQEYFQRALAQYPVPNLDVDMSDLCVRITNLSTGDDGLRYLPGNLNDRLTGEAIEVAGQVAQVSQALPEIQEGAFECQRCGTVTRMPQLTEDLQEPHECQACERNGPFVLDNDKSDFKMVRMLRLQRPPEESEGGETAVDIRLTDDLAEQGVRGAQRVTVPGKLRLQQGDSHSKQFPFLFEGHDTIPQDGSGSNIDYEDYEDEIREIAQTDDPVQTLADQIAPHLYTEDKLEAIKRALILQSVGTTRKDPDDGPTFRGDFHVLLLGDPSTGKSDLVEEIIDLAPRGKYKSGKGLSKAGITAAAVRDEFGQNEWGLKAGLLPLASGGIAGVDEIDKVDDDALDAVHSALENQTVTVMKAGIDANLPAYTRLLASGNPKHGRFEEYEPVGEQIDLPPALMSRFDLMFMVPDDPDPERDSEVAGHAIDAWIETSKMDHPGEESPEDSVATRDYDEEVLTAYFAKAQAEIQPRWPDDAELKQRIIEFYRDIRVKGMGDDAPVPITARKLQAILRLAEASARACLREHVTGEDVDRAIELVKMTLHDVGIDPETGEYDADIVETGTSKNQRERIRTVKEIIKDMEGDWEEGAPHHDIVDVANDIGMEKQKVEHELEKLKQKGEIYEPQSKHYRTS